MEAWLGCPTAGPLSLYVVSPLPVHVTFQCGLSRRGARLLLWRLKFSKNSKMEAARPIKLRPELAWRSVSSAIFCWLHQASVREESLWMGECGSLLAPHSQYTHPCKSHPNTAPKAGTLSPASGAGMEGPTGSSAPYALAQVQRPVKDSSPAHHHPHTQYVMVKETGNLHSTPLYKKRGQWSHEQLLICSNFEIQPGWHLSQLT